MHHHNVVVTRLLFDPIDGIKCNPTWQYTATMHITQPLSYRNTQKKNLNKNKQKKIKARTHSHLFCYVRNGSEREIEKMKQTQHSTAKRDGAESRCSVAFGKNISNMHLLACNQLHKKMLWFAFPYFGLMLLSPAFCLKISRLTHPSTPNTEHRTQIVEQNTRFGWLDSVFSAFLNANFEILHSLNTKKYNVVSRFIAENLPLSTNFHFS